MEEEALLKGEAMSPSRDMEKPGSGEIVRMIPTNSAPDFSSQLPEQGASSSGGLIAFCQPSLPVRPTGPFGVAAAALFLALAVGCCMGGVRRLSSMDPNCPGRTPRIFAPGIVSKGDIHGRLVVSPEGRAMLWTVFDSAKQSTQIRWSRKVGKRWSDPEPPPFVAGRESGSPVFSPDGRRLYFRVRTDAGWVTQFVEVGSGQWERPRGGSLRFNDSSSFTRSGKVYYSAPREGKIWGTGIYSARIVGEADSEPVPLDESINVPNAIDYTPFVSADESFLLFSSNRPRIGEVEDMHIYVSYRLGGGEWSKPQRLFDLNARFPCLSPDGRFLFLCGDDGNIYWVDARVVEDFRPAEAVRPGGS